MLPNLLKKSLITQPGSRLGSLSHNHRAEKTVDDKGDFYGFPCTTGISPGPAVRAREPGVFPEPPLQTVFAIQPQHRRTGRQKQTRLTHMHSRTLGEYQDLPFAPSSFRAVLPPHASIVNGTARVEGVVFLASSGRSRTSYWKDSLPNFDVQENRRKMSAQRRWNHIALARPVQFSRTPRRM